MVNFDDKQKKLIHAFKLTEEDQNVLDKFSKFLGTQEKTVPWVCRRIWIDEKLSDNAKCFAVFMLGRYYETVIGGEKDNG